MYDPMAEATLLMSKLGWSELSEVEHALWLDHYRALIDLRKREIVPRLAGISGFAGCCRVRAPRAVTIEWQLGDGMRLLLSANFSDRAVQPPSTAEG